VEANEGSYALFPAVVPYAQEGHEPLSSLASLVVHRDDLLKGISEVGDYPPSSGLQSVVQRSVHCEGDFFFPVTEAEEDPKQLSSIPLLVFQVDHPTEGFRKVGDNLSLDVLQAGHPTLYTGWCKKGMSQVIFRAEYQGRQVDVVSGWHRPLQGYHLTVFWADLYEDDDADDVVWGNLSLGNQEGNLPTTLETYVKQLSLMGIEPPPGFWELVGQQVGNVRWVWNVDIGEFCDAALCELG
jgi:hypothetical protein